MSGYLLINKPPGPTSHDVINALRRITHIERVGHAGTLDPFATGVLLVGVSREATRNLGKFVGLDKRYVAALQLGAVSNTFDKMGVIKTQNQKLKTKNYNAKFKTIIKRFVGKQKQIPPAFSAKKIKGKKAYELARKGKPALLAPQEIEIYSISIIRNSQFAIRNCFLLDIHCSSGTYIRTLAHDIGQKLGCGAYLEELTRTAVGSFTLEEATDLSQLTSENWQEHLMRFKTVMAQGTFEVLHPGHLFYLREAKKLGERLVVVVARQKRAEELRGRKLRAGEEERLFAVADLPFVNEAILGDEHDPFLSLIKIQPDIIALGYDQKVFVDILPQKIRELGLKTKIARIPAYKPEQYKSSLL